MYSFLDGLLSNFCFYTDFCWPASACVCARARVSVSEANRLPRLPF